jgi:hypothetical protein
MKVFNIRSIYGHKPSKLELLVLKNSIIEELKEIKGDFTVSMNEYQIYVSNSSNPETLERISNAAKSQNITCNVKGYLGIIGLGGNL